jgi:hypothetical protein
VAGELIRNAVIMTIHLDVIIDGGLDCLPVGSDVRLRRQRLQHGLVDGGEQGSARAFALSKRAHA